MNFILKEIKFNKLNSKYKKRVLNEFIKIKETGILEYILYAIEIKKILEDNGVPFFVRGSSGSLLIFYLLNFTKIDPLKNDINPERFINKYRNKMPDIDFDVPHFLREFIFDQIKNKWKNKSALISNHLYYREKSALNKSLNDLGFKSTETFNNIINIHYLNEQYNKNINKFNCYSKHCGGVVIFKEEINKEYLVNDFQIKYSKKEISEKGLFKFDILSNRGLSILYCLINDNTIKINYKEIPFNDNETYITLQNGKSIGIPFAESINMINSFKIIKPKNISDIAKALSLIRPASKTINNKYKGVFENEIIYDDDINNIIKKYLNCNLSKADYYRKEVLKDNKKVLEIFEKNKQTKLIKKILLEFKKYAFCKSHAFNYAYLTYILAYYKTHYKHQFWCHCLNNISSLWRPWVIYRGVINDNIEIVLDKPPWILKNNKITKKQIQTHFSINNHAQLKHYGYWLSKDFIINNKIKVVKNKKIVLGLIACVLHYYDTYFITLGIDNNIFIELVINQKIDTNNLLPKINNYNFIKAICENKENKVNVDYFELFN